MTDLPASGRSERAGCDSNEADSAEPLFPVYTVGCFACPHTVRETSPEAAHAAMEQHYRADHAAKIAALVGDLIRPERKIP